MSEPFVMPESSSNLVGLDIAVYGLGKMGLPLAAVLADNGAAVTGVDIDADVVDAVNRGAVESEEPGLAGLVEEHAGGRLTATTDGTMAAHEASVMIVLVPTIVDDDSKPDLTPILAAGDAISEGVTRDDLVILESTAPPGTTAGAFTEAVTPSALEAGVDFGVAHCPERTSSGRVITDLTESYSKIVGGTSEAATVSAGALYRVFNQPGVIEMPTATAAEAVKVFEGVYRDVNIALANELATVCEQWGLDARTVFDAANTQPYCEIHDPGVGVGGHCIPVYPHFVIDRGAETELLETAREVNDSMPSHTVDRTVSLLSKRGVEVDSANVLVLGVAYRPGVPEMRFAPAVPLIEALGARGATIAAHDPVLPADEIESTGARAVSDPLAESWDAVILVTGHEMYRDIDLTALADEMREPILVDGRGFFDEDAVDQFEYTCIGDGTTMPYPYE